jgi:hypothetical protein
MQELLLLAFGQQVPKPILGHEIPLWFAALLLFGLLCALTLIGSALFQWSRHLYRR